MRAPQRERKERARRGRLTLKAWVVALLCWPFAPTRPRWVARGLLDLESATDHAFVGETADILREQIRIRDRHRSQIWFVGLCGVAVAVVTTVSAVEALAILALACALAALLLVLSSGSSISPQPLACVTAAVVVAEIPVEPTVSAGFPRFLSTSSYLLLVSVLGLLVVASVRRGHDPGPLTRFSLRGALVATTGFVVVNLIEVRSWAEADSAVPAITLVLWSAGLVVVFSHVHRALAQPVEHFVFEDMDDETRRQEDEVPSLGQALADVLRYPPWGACAIRYAGCAFFVPAAVHVRLGQVPDGIGNALTACGLLAVAAGWATTRTARLRRALLVIGLTSLAWGVGAAALHDGWSGLSTPAQLVVVLGGLALGQGCGSLVWAAGLWRQHDGAVALGRAVAVGGLLIVALATATEAALGVPTRPLWAAAVGLSAGALVVAAGVAAVTTSASSESEILPEPVIE